MAENLPAPENFRRHWEVQKRHSGALAPLLETLFALNVYVSCRGLMNRNKTILSNYAQFEMTFEMKVSNLFVEYHEQFSNLVFSYLKV